ncbi:L-fucose:H+ symporter permease [Tunturiibacter empetritectus]|uniref:FHS family L-fucose permease-like MFS transporter n=2 Tax=Tunturiibacter TaxID=3154218 RepID=A0A852VF38_9BACT|nr:L-fucose:H+ symporter permease [Edaphobacter lichenicola]NYF90197.1 FHS family L-fucose permease-like MFS transporter [Edaphobacter lichenicola]
MIVSTPDPSAVDANRSAPLLPSGVLRAFLLITGLFFLWGIPNNLNDVLIRQFMKSFAISRFEAGLVQSAFYLGYFLLALPAGLLVKRKGYKAGFMTGLLLFASGCFLFLPAANSGRYVFFLMALFVVASGLAFLETASNPFIAQLGPTATSERRLNLAQAFNPLGAILGVLVGTTFIFSGIELTGHQIAVMRDQGTYTAYLHRETLRIVAPYLVLGTVALVWAVMILMTRFPTFIRTREHTAEISGNWRELLRYRHFLFAIVAQFLYVGAQVGTWSYFIQYAQDYAHTPEKTAGHLLTYTLGAFGLGRFSSTFLMKRFAPGSLMTVFALSNVALLLVGIFNPGTIGIGAVLLTSFFMSMMFPTIFAMGLKGLGANTNLGGSLLVMAIIGGAIITPLMGLIAEHTHSTAASYQLPLYAYLVIAVFAQYMRRYEANLMVTTTFEI